MLDVEKRYFSRAWITHDATKAVQQRLYGNHLPRLKPVRGHGSSTKHPLPRQPKRQAPTFLPPIASSISSGSTLPGVAHASSSSSNSSEILPSTTTFNSAVHDAARRFILRNNMARLSQDSPVASTTNNSHLKRTAIYKHIQAKVDTGLPRVDGLHANEVDTYQLEPSRPVNWSALKLEIEQDIHIRAYAKRMHFNSGVTFTTQLTTLGNLVRSKVKSHLSSPLGSGDDRYKIVAHMTVYPTTTATLYVASRCLWDTNTDNSIKIKMQGVDCDILIVVFLCYTDLGGL